MKNSKLPDGKYLSHHIRGDRYEKQRIKKIKRKLMFNKFSIEDNSSTYIGYTFPCRIQRI